jgi:hypothetical protein
MQCRSVMSREESLRSKSDEKITAEKEDPGTWS